MITNFYNSDISRSTTKSWICSKMNCGNTVTKKRTHTYEYNHTNYESSELLCVPPHNFINTYIQIFNQTKNLQAKVDRDEVPSNGIKHSSPVPNHHI